MKNMHYWKERIEAHIVNMTGDDASHDLGHLRRVTHVALQLADQEHPPPNQYVILAAALLHDIVSLPKNHPKANRSSFFAAKKAIEILAEIDFPKEYFPAIDHAIHAHSFSAKIPPQTLEAKCVQDADRLEALGAIGILRTFYIAGRLGTKLYHEGDPLAQHRILNDKQYALDHFELKLLTLQNTMQTQSGTKLAQERSSLLCEFRNQLADGYSSALFIANTCYIAGKKSLSLFSYVQETLSSKKDDSYSKKFLHQLSLEINVS